MEKRKSGVHYSTFNSHPDKEWVPTNEEVSNHWPRTNKWGPSNFKESNEEVSNHWPRTDPWDPSDFRESRKGKSCTEKAKGLGIDRPSSYRKIQKAVALIIPRAPLLNL
ncbi:uncharacterized protein N7473_007575 [Penicillium subrubescens]|uniref:uncharacterized protein n=1 Tax=Penicillium subrubescens TaxID=1316194 RepID=UPI0025452E30|nr:uncharacterized protein N7473_007575 [Penicillium subrubescens]KAJ5891347.1 hypothetical protein N7473_007575 [Penicillium subrubescens]